MLPTACSTNMLFLKINNNCGTPKICIFVRDVSISLLSGSPYNVLDFIRDQYFLLFRFFFFDYFLGCIQ